MNSIDLSATSFSYVDCDVPEGQSLREWRRERNAARRVARRPRRCTRLPRFGHLTILPRERPAW